LVIGVLGVLRGVGFRAGCRTLRRCEVAECNPIACVSESVTGCNCDSKQ